MKDRSFGLCLFFSSVVCLSACSTTPTPEAAAVETVAVAEPPPAPALPAGQTAIVAAGSVLLLQLDDEIHTARAKPKDGFGLHVDRALVVDGYTVIPAGAVAYGEVVHAQKAGMLGKPAELLLSVRWVEVNGQRIPMRHFRPIAGKSNQGAVMAMSFVPVAGLFAPFIMGGQIVLKPGTIAAGQVVADTVIRAP